MRALYKCIALSSMFYKNKTNTTCQKKKKMKQQSNSVYHDKKKNTKSTTNWQKKMRFQNKRHLEFERAKRKKLEEGKERNRKGKRTNDMCVCGEELSLIRECFTSCVCTWSVKCECCESVVSVFCKYVRWMIQSKKKKKIQKDKDRKKNMSIDVDWAWQRREWGIAWNGTGWDGMEWLIYKLCLGSGHGRLGCESKSRRDGSPPNTTFCKTKTKRDTWGKKGKKGKRKKNIAQEKKKGEKGAYNPPSLRLRALSSSSNKLLLSILKPKSTPLPPNPTWQAAKETYKVGCWRR